MTGHERIGQSGLRYLHLEETGSTSAEAMRLALSGETGPLWVVADRQTAGRGRSGRSWTSLPGNLSASLLLSLAIPPAAAARLSLVAGVALFETVRVVAGDASLEGLSLKWPNDLLFDEAKVAGILVESSACVGRLTVVVGFGVNLVAAPEIEGRRVGTLADVLRRTVSPLAFLEALDAALRHWLAVFDEDRGRAEIIRAWLAVATPLGAAISVSTTGGLVRGRFDGLDPDGALRLIDVSGDNLRFSYGDVTLASEAETS